MTDLFIDNIIGVINNNISKKILIQARYAFIDYLSCAIAGSVYLKDKDIYYIKALGGTSESSSILGTKFKTDKLTAALINGINSHVLELDDGHRGGALHVGATVFSALLAVSEQETISSTDFLYGSIIGYEAVIRLACAIQPGNKLRGYHATSTCGVIGATLGIATALHFDKEQTKSAISAAVTCASGVLEMQEDGSDLKPFNVGHAAMNAVSCAYLGKARFKAPDDAIGGKRGFLKVMTEDSNPEWLTDFSGTSDTLMIEQIYQKTYASCRHTHPAIEAALILRHKILTFSKYHFSDIISIKVETYKLAVTGHDHKDIQGVSSAKMSLPFCVALSLIKGTADLEAFSKNNIYDKEILTLMEKVSVVTNDNLTLLVPQKRASILTITMSDGFSYYQRIDYPKGEPENPLTDRELLEKFYKLTSIGGVSHNYAQDVISEIQKSCFSISNIISKLTPIQE